MPEKTVRRQLWSAIDLIVHMDRIDGLRRVATIARSTAGELAEAYEFLKLMGCLADMSDVVVVERLPNRRHADVIDGIVAVEKDVFAMKPVEIAQKIFPAVICCEHDVDPFSASYDEVVLDLFFDLTERLKTSIDRKRVFKPGGDY